MIRDFDLLPPLGLALLVAAAPLPFGSVGAIESRLLYLGLAVLGVVTAVRSPDQKVLRASWIPAAVLAGIACYGIFQSFLPPIRLAAPQETADSLIAVAALQAFAPEVSRSVAVSWLAAALAVLVGAQAGRAARGRRVLLAGLVVTGLFQAAYGGQRWAGDSSMIWGRGVAGDAGRFRGTFVNPDHLAFLLGMILPAVLAWAWWSARRRARGLTGRALVEATLAAAAAPVLIWVTLFVALALTGSRAAILVTVVVSGFQGLLLAYVERRWRIAAIGGGLSLLGLAAVWWLSLEGQALGRLLGTSRYELQWNDRLAAYEAALELWSRSPLLGVGLGNFRQAFPLVQPETLVGTWWHAHSDLLEVGVTLGLIGLLLLAVTGFLCLKQLWKGTVAERSEDRAAVVAVLGSVLAAGLHSAVDFSLTMPANALVLCSLVGCGLAASTADSRGASTQRVASDRSPGVK